MLGFSLIRALLARSPCRRAWAQAQEGDSKLHCKVMMFPAVNCTLCIFNSVLSVYTVHSGKKGLISDFSQEAIHTSCAEKVAFAHLKQEKRERI